MSEPPCIPMSSTASPSPPTLTHQSSHRLTPTISLHAFSSVGTSAPLPPILPTQHVVLQLPPDLDPIGGARALTAEDRRLQVTPCRVDYDDGGGCGTIELLTRRGRVTSLIGLPRPGGLGLEARVVGPAGGGFPVEVVLSPTDGGSGRLVVAVAGGTGVACFLRGLGVGSACAEEEEKRGRAKWLKRRLLWSIRGEDFALVEFVLGSGILRHSRLWDDIRVFVTSGEDISSGLVASKGAAWWEGKFREVEEKFGGDVTLKCGRMGVDDLFREEEGPEEKTVLFCGSSSLQWQVKMWALSNKVTVHVTAR